MNHWISLPRFFLLFHVSELLPLPNHEKIRKVKKSLFWGKPSIVEDVSVTLKMHGLSK